MLMCAVTFSQTAADFSALDKYLQKLDDGDQIKGSVVVSSGGKAIYEWQSGSAWYNQGEERKTDSNTPLAIGSTTKMMTSVMVLQMAEEGLLSLDQSLEGFYPNMPGAEKIQISDLLGHTSGLANFTAEQEFLHWMHRGKDRDEMLEWFAGFDLVFEPGSEVAYSNTNYVLLGYILEDVTGKSFGKLLNERISGPLGLENTFFTRDEVPGHLQSTSFIRTNWDWVPMVPEMDLNNAHAAGGGLSTGSDLNVFISALFNGQLISEKSLQSMIDTREGFGYGLLETPFYHHLGFGHYGSLDEYYIFVAHYPEAGIEIAVLCNGLDEDFSRVLKNVLSNVLEKDPKTEPLVSISIDEDELSLFTGSYYNLESGMELNITVEGGHLKISGPDDKSIYPVPVHDFLFEDQSLDTTRFSFLFDGRGSVESLLIKNSSDIILLNRNEVPGS